MIKQHIVEFRQVIKLQAKMAEVLSYKDNKDLIAKLNEIHKRIPCPHNQSHVLAFIVELLSIPKDIIGYIVEAGCFKGGSAAKISIIAKMLNRNLIIFDSFEGLPDNDENHEKSIFGHSIKDWFTLGSFCGHLEEVMANIKKYGEIEYCDFIKGWFEDTMPSFEEPIVAAYIDVDLASSTRTCIKYLYPLIVKGGILISQDGDFPLVVEVFNDDNFWENEVGCRKPEIEGLGRKKILKIIKP